ncbi:MAG: hypothetical protein KGL39_00880 [Patescibacteria group bacterium]|nr:hypothetical protein [Patescibacteria group bacterium]
MMNDYSLQVGPDILYANLIHRVLQDGENITTRNSKVRRLFAEKLAFCSNPLLSVRKTAWRNALREWEWFMSGSNRLEDLHPSVRPWWVPFCKVDKNTLCYNYSSALRRLYTPEHGKPLDVQPSVLEKEESVIVPVFSIREVAKGNAKHLGYSGVNYHGDKFRVVDFIEGVGYVVQFLSNGYQTRSIPANFLHGTVKNPYYPTVLGVGCLGVINRDGYSYWKRAYRLWSGMMNRCYNCSRKQWKWYGGAGIKVSGRWKCFEYFLDDLSRIPGFEEWLSSTKIYHLDKDYRKANYYGPDVCVFLPGNRNIALASAERFYDVPRKQLYIDQIECLLDGIRNHPFSRRNLITSWIPSHVYGGLSNPTNCHNTVTQTFVDDDNKLHLVTYQRSVDVICGLPHNLVQEWSFLLWLAHHGNRQVGSLTWIGGDVHIYETHLELAQEIRDTAYAGKIPSPPELVYKPSEGEMYKADDFTLAGEYKPIITKRAEMII